LGDDLTSSLEHDRETGSGKSGSMTRSAPTLPCRRLGQVTERGGSAMRMVIALGGNALLRRGDPMTTEVQRRNITVAAEAIAPLAAEHSVVVVHGNGPQVGLLSLQAESYADAEPYPLDVLDAGTQGMIGYLIQQELRSLLPAQQQVATLLTMIVVDPHDPAFARPAKFVGPVYHKDAADALAGADHHRRDRGRSAGCPRVRSRW
jgi:carbamate kinase